MITWGKSNRGFVRGQFEDRYDKSCSIQRSSIAFEDCIWLGIDDPTVINEKYMPTELPKGYNILSRMHLTREMCADLGKLLTSFAETGSLNGDYSEEQEDAS